MTDDEVPVGVYRAPMWSRDGRVPRERSVRHALDAGVVGMGAATDERGERRLRRFAEVHVGAFVWTMLPPSTYLLGRITGPCIDDMSDEAVAADLAHVRRCDWSTTPVDEGLVPDGVRATFARGGRNFQRIHAPGTDGLTRRVWELMAAERP